MSPVRGLTMSVSLACLALLMFLLASETMPPPTTTGLAAPDRCPAGQSPLPFVHLADVPLPANVPPYAKMSLSRISLQPGETYDFAPSGFTAYFVESGALKYRADRPGFAIMESPKCETPDGHYSAHGHFETDEDGMALVKRGEALISDAIATGPIANGGDGSLVMLQMTLVLPMIDSGTGKPIPDSVTLARAQQREREQRKQACRALASPVAGAESPPTPTLVPIAPAEDLGQTKTPKACRN